MNTEYVDVSDTRAMVKNLRNAPVLAFFFGVSSIIFSIDQAGKLFVTGVIVTSSSFVLLSVFGLIYLYFRKKSVKTIILIQGLEVTCMMLTLLLFFYVGICETKFYTEAPLYYMMPYALLAIFAMIYGRNYAIKRWKPRAEWLGLHAQSCTTVPSNVLYANFFANPDSNIGKKLVFWVGLSVPMTIVLRHLLGDEALLISVSLMMTWVTFAQLSNLVVRYRLIQASLGERDLQVIE